MKKSFVTLIMITMLIGSCGLRTDLEIEKPKSEKISLFVENE